MSTSYYLVNKDDRVKKVKHDKVVDKVMRKVRKNLSVLERDDIGSKDLDLVLFRTESELKDLFHLDDTLVCSTNSSRISVFYMGKGEVRDKVVSGEYVIVDEYGKEYKSLEAFNRKMKKFGGVIDGD